MTRSLPDEGGIGFPMLTLRLTGLVLCQSHGQPLQKNIPEALRAYRFKCLVWHTCSSVWSGIQVQVSGLAYRFKCLVQTHCPGLACGVQLIYLFIDCSLLCSSICISEISRFVFAQSRYSYSCNLYASKTCVRLVQVVEYI